MPKYAEIIFETGSKSLVQYEDESEVRGFITEHDRRARSGEVGGPLGHPAERVTKVLLYDKHPTDDYEEGLVDASAVRNFLDAATDNSTGKVSIWRLQELLRDEASPVYPQDQGRHESIYKAEEVGELDLSFLNNAGGEV